MRVFPKVLLQHSFIYLVYSFKVPIDEYSPVVEDGGYGLYLFEAVYKVEGVGNIVLGAPCLQSFDSRVGVGAFGRIVY